VLLVEEELKRELSNSELANRQFDQTVEHRRGIAEACRQVLLHAMKDLLVVAHPGGRHLNGFHITPSRMPLHMGLVSIHIAD